MRAAYTDKGTNTIPGLSTENIVALRSPTVNPQLADEKKGAQLVTTPVVAFYMAGNNSYLGYNNIDLSGIKEIQFTVQAQPRAGAVGGVIEVHLDKPDGKLIGKTDSVASKDIDFRKFMGDSNAKPKDKPGAKPGAPKTPPKIDFDAIMKMMNVQAKATIEPTEGFHNIYFVFKNDKGGADKIIMQAVQINFLNAIALKK